MPRLEPDNSTKVIVYPSHFVVLRKDRNLFTKAYIFMKSNPEQLNFLT